MNKRNSVIIMLIVFLAIGFATVSTTLVISGRLAIGENKDDFEIIFTSAKLDGRKRNDFISEDKKHINFVSNELKTLDDKAILTYEITNTSRNYDADITLTCTAGTTELITLEYSPHQMEILAGETKSGTLTVSMLKVVDSPKEVPIELTFTATAKTREELGDEYVPPFSRSGVMMRATNNYSNPTGMWSYRSNITKVEFEDKLIPKETTEDLTFDVSEKQDKSVMAYLVANEEELTTNKDVDNKDLTDTTAYTLYIQGDTGIIANKASSSIFAYFNNLKEIKNLQYMDTSNVTNMSYMFSDCSNLTTLDVTSLDTSKVTNMASMFSDCNNLTILDVTNFDTSKATDMSSMFYNCNNLTTLDLSNFDTSNVTSMFYMFTNCNNLTTLDVNNFDTVNVTNMSNMFKNCNNLTILDLSSFNTSNVTIMGYMFSNCNSLIALDLSNFDTQKVTRMEDMFSNCSKLEKLDISNFNTSNVTEISGIFSQCESLAYIDVNSFDTSNIKGMSYVFGNCKNLKKLDLSNFDTSKVTDMESMFYGCKSLTELNLSNFDTSNVTNMSDMFRNCTNLINIDLSSFNTSKVTNMEAMFLSCTSLKKLNIGNFNTSNVTKMNSICTENGYLNYSIFQGCSSLEELNLDNFDISNLTTLSHMFFNCKNLKKLSIKNFNLSNIIQMQDMFYHCSNLEELDISNWNIEAIVDKDINTIGVFKDLILSNIEVYVKDTTAQNWILNLSTTDRPSSWTADNVLIKEVA